VTVARGVSEGGRGLKAADGWGHDTVPDDGQMDSNDFE
jgi:hypothetical protein